MSGCRDSRQTSGSRHSGQEVDRAEQCRRVSQPDRSSCCRHPDAGSLGPSCGPGHPCIHSVQLAHSHHPAPETLWEVSGLVLVSRSNPPSRRLSGMYLQGSDSLAGRPGPPYTRLLPAGLSSCGGSGWHSSLSPSLPDSLPLRRGSPVSRTPGCPKTLLFLISNS